MLFEEDMVRIKIKWILVKNIDFLSIFEEKVGNIIIKNFL